MDNEPPTRVARSNSRAVCARDVWLISACGHPSCACFGATSVHCLRVLPRAVVGSAPSSHMHEVPSNAFSVDEYMGRGLAVVFMFDPFTRGLGELLFLNHAPCTGVPVDYRIHSSSFVRVADRRTTAEGTASKREINLAELWSDGPLGRG